jgi:hypothetical protein
VARQTKRKSPGLDVPPFEYADRVTSRETARNCFFQAIARVAPEVLGDLAREPWRQFQRIKTPLPEAHNVLEDIRAGRTGAFVWPPVAWNLTPGLKQALVSWQSKHHLTAAWCEERALWTLARWRREPKARGKEWEHPEPQPTLRVVDGADPAARYGRSPRPFDLRIYGWDPLQERWESWLQREDIAGKLSAYRCRVEEAAEHAGLTRTPGKRELLHFEWLAYYEVRACSYEAIAEHAHKERKTVEGGVKHAARLVGLDLRRAKRGRPPGVKERVPRQVSDAGIRRREKRSFAF